MRFRTLLLGVSLLASTISANAQNSYVSEYNEFRPIAHFAGCEPPQICIPTGVLRDSNVSECKSMFENAQ